MAVTRVIFLGAFYTEDQPGDNVGYFLSVIEVSSRVNPVLCHVQNPRSKRGINQADEGTGVMGLLPRNISSSLHRTNTSLCPAESSDWLLWTYCLTTTVIVSGVVPSNQSVSYYQGLSQMNTELGAEKGLEVCPHLIHVFLSFLPPY